MTEPSRLQPLEPIPYEYSPGSQPVDVSKVTGSYDSFSAFVILCMLPSYPVILCTE